MYRICMLKFDIRSLYSTLVLLIENASIRICLSMAKR